MNKSTFKPYDWKDFQNEIFDCDGCNPADYEKFQELMREYRDYSSLTDFYFVNPHKCPDNHNTNNPLFYDQWNDNQLREAYEIGPCSNEIDFTGLN